MHNHWLIQIAYGQLDMIQSICLLIHIFYNDIVCSAECYELKTVWRSTKIPYEKLPSSRAFFIASVRFTRAC